MAHYLEKGDVLSTLHGISEFWMFLKFQTGTPLFTKYQDLIDKGISEKYWTAFMTV
jgi:hypothetical protein